MESVQKKIAVSQEKPDVIMMITILVIYRNARIINGYQMNLHHALIAATKKEQTAANAEMVKPNVKTAAV
jgi:hypothetical protein